MGKYLNWGAMSLFAGLFITSCTHDDVELVTTADQKLQTFEQKFTEFYGTIDPNQDWGFNQEVVETPAAEARRVRTRAAEGDYDITSTYDATFTRDFYTTVLEKLPEGQNAANQLNNYEFLSKGPFQFNVVYFNTGGYDDVGYYYYNPETETIADRHEVIFLGGLQSNYANYLQLSWDNGANWGWPDGAYLGNTQNYVKEITHSRSKTITLNIPAGYRVGFYMKQGDNKMYSNKTLNWEQNYYSAVVNLNNDRYLVGLEDWMVGGDFDCNDLIIAIDEKTSTPPVIVTPETKTQVTEEDVKTLVEAGRIFCEDLGQAATREDLDYNDVVFDAKIWKVEHKLTTKYFTNNVEDESRRTVETTSTRYDAEVVLLAAGGTLPLTVAGREVHNLFGQNVDVMVNTRNDNSVAYGAYTTHDPVNMGIVGHYSRIIDIPIQVQYKNDAVILEATRGKAPHKLLVSQGLRWANERCNIADAYPKFREWVGGNLTGNEKFSDTAVENYLYEPVAGLSTQTVGTTEAENETTTTTTNPTEIVLWNGEVALSESPTISLNTSAYKDYKAGDKILIYGTHNHDQNNHAAVAAYATDNSGTCFRSWSNIDDDAEYAVIELTADWANRLKSSPSIAFQGHYFTVTKITVQ